ncbi:hypothetical protein KAS33_00430 [bacterium]|nr:hypothetical protein [bacterium]
MKRNFGKFIFFAGIIILVLTGVTAFLQGQFMIRRSISSPGILVHLSRFVPYGGIVGVILITVGTYLKKR